MNKFIRIISIIITILILGACTNIQPKNINNACSIIHQHPHWYYYMLDSYYRWGIPINIQMAFVRKESSFKASAKTPMKYYIGFIPKGRASSAYGYSQALDGTWNQYQKQTKKFSASRKNYSDAVDFIGWYLNNINNKIGISKNNTYDLYLAYHEGLSGYKRGNHKNNQSLKNYARQTATIAKTYSIQLNKCNIPSKPLLYYIL